MDPALLDRLPRPGVLASAVGVVRVVGVLLLIATGTLVLLVSAVLPVSVRGVRLPVFVAVGLARALLWIIGARLVTNGRAVLETHRGFVFFNHHSWLDAVVLLAVRPVRFLATQGVRRIPFIGWIASAIGTLFVNRGRDESREASRVELREAVARSPLPVALAPEGEIGPGPGVLPLRHGAFEVAQDADADILLVALTFAPPGYAVWNEEWLLAPLWRASARLQPFSITLTALPPVLETRPDGGTTPAALAEEAAQRLDGALVGEMDTGYRGVTSR